MLQRSRVRMGWFTSLFERTSTLQQQQAAPPEIHVYDLEDWLLSRQNTLLSNDLLGKESVRYAGALTRTTEAIQKALKEWKAVPKSLLQQGQHKAFFTSLQKFIDLMVVPEKPTLHSILAVHSRVRKHLPTLILAAEEYRASLAAEFGKTKSVLPASFVHELDALHLLEKEFEQRIVKSGFSTLDSLRQKAVLLEQLMESIQEIKKDLDGKQTRLASASGRLEQKEMELQVLQEGAHYSTWRQIEYRRTQLLQQQGEVQDDLISFFAKIKPALEQLARQEVIHPITHDYVRDPIRAILLDSNLAVLPVLGKLKDVLQRGALSCGVEQASSLVAELEKARQLSQHRTTLQLVQEQLKEVQASLQHTGFLVKIQEAKFRRDHFAQQVGKLEQEVHTGQQELQQQEKLRVQQVNEFERAVGTIWGLDLHVKV